MTGEAGACARAATSAHRRAIISRRAYLLLFLLALGVRSGVGAWQLSHATVHTLLELPDEQQYWLMASNFAAGNSLRDELGFVATRMPLYPCLLAPFTQLEHGIIAAKALQWAIGATMAALTAQLGALLGGRRLGIVAGALVALDPFLVYFSSLLLTETLSGACLLLLANRAAGMALTPEDRRTRNWVTFGALAALCIYVREANAALALLLAAFIVLRRGFAKRAIVGAVTAILVAVLLLVPWAIRNRVVLGEWIWLTTRGGISLYDGLGPQADGSSDLRDVKQMDAVAGLGEVAWHRHFTTESIRLMKEQPERAWRLALIKLGRTWNPVPNAEAYQSRMVRAIAAAWSVPSFTLAVIGAILWIKRDRGVGGWTVLFLLLPALFVCGLHCFFVGSVRYRVSVMPMIAVLGAFALAAMMSRIAIPPRQDGHDPAR